MKLHTTIWSTAVLALSMATGTSLLGADRNTQENRGQFSERDYRFVTEAARGGMLEVQLGQLAQQKASSQGIRDFAQRMVTDHSKANDELKQIATSKGATLPTEISRRENLTMEHLQKLSGADFDKAYASDMLKDHKKDLREFQDAARDVKDPELRAFAEKTANVIQEHLRMAEGLEGLK